MKTIRNLIIILIILIALGVIGLGAIEVDVDDSSLSTIVYEEDANLTDILQAKFISLFVSGSTEESSLVEDIINLVIYDSIKNNINSDYDPLGDCETTECNYVIYEDYYYINYIFAEMNDDGQLVLTVSFGTEEIIEVNTILVLVFDVDIKLLSMSIELTLDKYYLAEYEISKTMLDRIFSKIDTENIESQVSKGELNLEEYTYTISFSPFS